jgi:hypothetical protein
MYHSVVPKWKNLYWILSASLHDVVEDALF